MVTSLICVGRSRFQIPVQINVIQPGQPRRYLHTLSVSEGSLSLITIIWVFHGSQVIEIEKLPYYFLLAIMIPVSRPMWPLLGIILPFTNN